MKLIKNAKVITPTEVFNGAVIVEGSIIRDVVKGEVIEGKFDEVYDAKGSYIMPGIIDIHADDIEKELQPRPTSIFPIDYAFRESEKKLINKGITTMFHSMAIYDGNYFGGQKIRTQDFVEKMAAWINNNKNKGLIKHKFHLRYEMDNLTGVEYVKEMLKTNQINLLSFMDHTPGQGQYRDLEKYRKSLVGYKGATEADIERVLQARMNAPMISKETLEDIAKIAREHEVAIASHDDDTKEKIDYNISWGAAISEFPITLEVAKYAKEKDLYVMVGAPNIVMGGSHSGNLSAAEAINNGCVDIICSDYKPSTIISSIFYMHIKHNQPLNEMVNLATLNPAESVNIGDKIGSIEKGKVFDALQVALIDNMPVVEKVWVDGELTSMLNYNKIKDIQNAENVDKAANNS